MTDFEKMILNELNVYFGENICAVFGILGNMKAESNCNPKNLQNSFEKKLGFTDETYTQALNDGTYTKEQFIYDKAGYGLCQWTFWSRKAALYDYWKKEYKLDGISSIFMQVGFINHEMSSKLRNKLMAAETVEEATRIFMLEYEKPADQSLENIEKRCKIARDLYIDWINENSTPTVLINEDEENEEDIYESRKGFSYLQIVTSLENMKVYLDIMINAVKSLAKEDSHD